MGTFLKDHPTLAEVLQFIAKDNLENKEMAKELLMMDYAQEVIEKTLELRKQPVCQDYGIEQGFYHFRISREEALRFLESYGLMSPENVEPVKQTKETKVEEQEEEAVSGDSLIRDGDHWRYSYNGKKAGIGDLKGVGDLAYLLSSPGREFESIDLILHHPIDVTPLNEMTDEQLDKLGLSRGHLDGKTSVRLSNRNMDFTRNELRKLEGEIDKAKRDEDSLLLKELNDEKASLMRLIKGLGEEKPLSQEKARFAVRKRIKVAIDKIREQHPELADHLTQSMKYGKACSYIPNPPTTWEVRL